ncbi:TadG family pilus assembly protein [Variovorax sp. V213]|uniref:TadG family pilus assembly protein n=1 Tax=Variovorax sp. V213 TaxID=3065955 RepID=UPI0034E8D304
MHPFNRRTPGRQSGSVVINSVIALSLLVIVLVGTELGYLFFLKRELQKTADLAALAGAQVLEGDSCMTATAAAIANAARNFPTGLAPVAADSVVCGHWDPASRPTAPHFGPPESGQKFNAVRVTINRTPALLLAGIPGNQPRPVAVDALAAQRHPLAALNIRSTLVSVDTQSPLLNAVFGGLLGGSLNLDAVGWNGLITTELKLLTFLDELALELGIGAGKYDQVLAADVAVGTLVQAMINALQRNGGTAQAAIDALNLVKIAANAAPAQPLLKLGNLLGAQAGTDAAGLDTNIQVFQLLQGVVQAANGKNGVVADVNLAGVSASIKVIEPPQMSAVGNPALAKLNPTGPNQIYVRTAQVRTFFSIDLPALNGVSDVANAVLAAATPVTDLLNNLLSLNLVTGLTNLLNCVLGCTRDVTDIKILPAPLRLDISLDAGGGSSHVTDFNCAADAKSLTAQTVTSIANLRIGNLGATVALAKANAFASSTAPVVSSLPIIDIGSQSCVLGPLGIGKLSCDTAHRKAFYGGGLGLKAELPIGATTQSQFFQNPPDLDGQPAYLAISTQNVVNSLSNTLSGLSNLMTTIPPTAPNGGLPGVLTALTNTLSGVVTALQGVVSDLLGPLLDPLLTALLGDVLGASLAQTEVGARLSCSKGAELVY